MNSPNSATNHPSKAWETTTPTVVSHQVDRLSAEWGGLDPSWSEPSACVLTEDDYPSRLAQQLDDLLGCHVWIATRNRGGRLVAMHASRSAQTCALSDRALAAIAEDAIQSTTPIAVGCPQSLPLLSTAVMQQAWQEHPGFSSMSMGLPMPHHHHQSVLTLAWRDEAQHPRALALTAWLELHSISIGKTLEAWSFCQLGRDHHRRLEWWADLMRTKTGWMLTAILLVLGAMTIPVPYRPKRDCQLEPATRSYVASPVEGRLTRVWVRPGEEVKSGQVLAKLDDAQIERELAAAQAELQTQNKKRDVALATRAGGDLRIAQLECQQVQLKIESLLEQRKRLEITSPSDGIIVQGDWYGNEGMPVTFGQTLFEIASLDRMIAEVHLTASDLPWVKTGATTTLRTEATLGQAWQGTLIRIEPRAEIIEDQAVFIGEVEIDNTDALLRPGMKAQVTVDAGQKSIGWMLFRQPMQWFQHLWVW